ncbi:hypothetical protein ASG73_12380 [Janibacter sp. Soil728]|uniref:hypothetical protein n=1 Tax=Janibacter sp. Soil728 TaxID=1736393 RepID=UPI0007000FFB|nr:hypothetical protein [Janibacter sp. Soil728]KRE37089.1 hypothetical protein ASG73_12380 [Janibacter sp. Soil728]
MKAALHANRTRSGPVLETVTATRFAVHRRASGCVHSGLTDDHAAEVQRLLDRLVRRPAHWTSA